MQHVDVAIIGGGIGGLVAANYLRREGGLSVVILEKKERVGGACYRSTIEIQGKKLDYPLGATVLGMMQRFIFEETGLAAQLPIYRRNYKKIVFLPSRRNPIFIHSDSARLAKELRKEVGEMGDVEAFRRDEAMVVEFLQRGFCDAAVPTYQSACAALGENIVKRWITGSAQDLLNHYFTSDATKLYMGMTVIESCGTSFSSPFSAFTIPLMDSGSVFDGYWGFVKGGLYALTEKLGEINREIGVEVITNAEVVTTNPDTGHITYYDGSGVNAPMTTISAERIVFGTDPWTASELMRQPSLVAKKKTKGTSGKLILAFDGEVHWKHKTYKPEAFRFIYGTETLEALEKQSRRVADNSQQFSPGYIQIYCEGAGQRRLGNNQPYDTLIAFFKNIGNKNPGNEMPEVTQYLKEQIFAELYNPQKLVWEKLLTPYDLEREFGLPGGNIDHLDLCDGQQAWDRTFSNDPQESFYRFGDFENTFICSAGVYPCGSVAGTGGYMCAKEIIRLIKKRK